MKGYQEGVLWVLNLGEGFEAEFTMDNSQWTIHNGGMVLRIKEFGRAPSACLRSLPTCVSRQAWKAGSFPY